MKLLIVMYFTMKLYHLDDGTYQYNGIVIKNFGPIGKINDIIGAGIIYLSETNFQPFFTINGKLIEKKIPEITIIQKITPMIGFDHSHKIKYNFGENEFKFNLKNYIHGRQIISLNNIFFKKKNQKKTFNSSKFKIIDKKEITNNDFNTTLLNSIITELQQQQTTTFTEISEQNIFNEPLFLTNQQNNFFSFTINN